ncbi:MAG: hypothetical protein Q4E77_07495 [Conchiformibius sp.]|nr:hypothetical protein [Conchiformibius sp.]
MNTVTKNRPTPCVCRTQLRRLCLIADGNAHQTALPDHRSEHADRVSEAMLPEIRAVALLIAAERRQLSRHSPSHFSDDADWLAARIIVLNIRTLHLPDNQQFMLDTANSRARAFARRFSLPFRPAKRQNAHTSRGQLLADCALGGTAHANLFENTQALRKIVFKLPKTFPNHGKLQ